MIDSKEFNLALTCAAKAAEPGESWRTEFQGVLFDFRPDNTLRLVGTNAQRLVVVTLCNVAHGQTLRQTIFTPVIPEMLQSNPRVSLYPMGPEMIVLGSDGQSTSVPNHPVGFPDYESVMTRRAHATPAVDSWYSIRYLTEALDSLTELADGAVKLELYEHFPVFITPRLREGFEHIQSVEIAIMLRGAANAP